MKIMKKNFTEICKFSYLLGEPTPTPSAPTPTNVQKIFPLAIDFSSLPRMPADHTELSVDLYAIFGTILWAIKTLFFLLFFFYPNGMKHDISPKKRRKLWRNSELWKSNHKISFLNLNELANLKKFILKKILSVTTISLFFVMQNCTFSKII